MAEEAARSRLGRGLAALIGDVRAETSVDRPRGQRRLPTGALRPNARNPRRAFADAELEELAASVRERGIIQPIIVRPLRSVDDEFEIIAGERRWRAAQRAALHEVPVVVIEATDAEALQLAIIENVQRADLNALEEAEGYRALIDEFNNSQDEIVRIVSETVKRWDARTVTGRIEGAVGRDLQFIRINGTLVGGLVGVLIHTVDRLL